MKRLRLVGVLALVVALTALAAACGGEEEAAPPAPPAETEPAPPAPPAETGGEEPAPPAEPAPPPAAEIPVGGTLRVDVEAAFDFYSAFDPSGEYTARGWSYYTALIRKLVTYKGRPGAEGSEVFPDLATDLGTVSEDQLTWTFTLKDGIMFGPPLNRPITSQDFVTALERVATIGLEAGGYPFYYYEIVGFEEFGAGEADTIAGIETPDDKTIVFKLEKPVGDLLFKLAMPAAGPIPEEVAGCFTTPGDYGRYVISSGPYMIEGSENLDATSCDTLEPISGFDPESFLIFVRNPNYDPATDSPELRGNYVDRMEWRINSNADDCFSKVAQAIIDAEECGETGKQIKEYTENEDLQDNIHFNPDDSLFYIGMNLAIPPFDDVHVRKAANLIMNKPALIRAWGGPTVGEVATHSLTPSLAGPDLEGYDPYATPNSEGDLTLAMEEMKQSRYDTDGDGLCDAPECKDVLHIAGTDARGKGMTPVIEESLAKIGITLRTRALDDPYSIVQKPKEKVPIESVSGWGKDYPDASTFFVLLDGRAITPVATSNQTLTGLTPEMAAEIGIPYPPDGVPSIDADIDRCNEIAEPDERLSCWGEVTVKSMEEAVMWIPYIWRNQTSILADSVVNWDFDQATGSPAWVHIAVDPEKQNS